MEPRLARIRPPVSMSAYAAAIWAHKQSSPQKALTGAENAEGNAPRARSTRPHVLYFVVFEQIAGHFGGFVPHADTQEGAGRLEHKFTLLEKGFCHRRRPQNRPLGAFQGLQRYGALGLCVSGCFRARAFGRLHLSGS